MLGSPYRLFYGLSCNVAAQEWLDCYHYYVGEHQISDTDSYCDCGEDQDTDCDWEHECS